MISVKWCYQWWLFKVKGGGRAGKEERGRERNNATAYPLHERNKVKEKDEWRNDAKEKNQHARAPPSLPVAWREGKGRERKCKEVFNVPGVTEAVSGSKTVEAGAKRRSPKRSEEVLARKHFLYPPGACYTLRALPFPQPLHRPLSMQELGPTKSKDGTSLVRKKRCLKSDSPFSRTDDFSDRRTRTQNEGKKKKKKKKAPMGTQGQCKGCAMRG